MKLQDHDFYRELVYLEPDGPLPMGERTELRRHLEGCLDCRTLRGELSKMEQLLTSAKLEVDPALKGRVLAALPPAAWESRQPASWGFAAALLALVGGASVAVAALGGASPIAGTILGLVDMLRSATLTGAGLLTASWQGVGLAIQDSLGASPLGLAAFGVVVVGLDVLFLRFLLRASRSPAPARVATRDLDARS